MSEVHAYRASDELAAALREFAVRDDEFGKRIEEFDRANPGHELLWAGRALSADRRPVGFKDGTDDVPAGLSRSKTRVELVPKKTKSGYPWQAVLDDMRENRPTVEPVLREYGVPTAARGGMAPSGGMYVSATQWSDTGETGVIVFNGGDLERTPFGHDGPLTGHLTPIPLSEFYAIKERLDAEREAAVAS